MKRIRWRGLERGSSELLTLQTIPWGYALEGVHIDFDYGLTYVIEVDPAWQFQKLTLKMIGEERSLSLVYEGRGRWTDGEKNPLPFLKPAREIDLTISPVTNTLPIRRLELGIGQSAEIVTAYVDFPSLEITADPQRYTRLSERGYRYESLDSDFVREIEVDEEGFVVEYPGLFTREVPL